MYRIIALLALVVSPGGAAVTYYQGVDLASAQSLGPNSIAAFSNFNLAAGTTGVLDFEAVSVGTTSGTVGSIAGVGVGASCTGCVGPFLGVVDTSYQQLGYNTTAGGAKYFQISSDFGGTSTFTLTFSAPVQSFGVYITGIQVSLGTTTFAFNDGSAQSGALLGSSGVGQPSTSGSQFLGIITSGSFTSISFTTISAAVNDRDIWGLDDITYSATVVPEPTTLLPLGLALAALGYRLRRRT